MAISNGGGSFATTLAGAALRPAVLFVRSHSQILPVLVFPIEPIDAVPQRETRHPVLNGLCVVGRVPTTVPESFATTGEIEFDPSRVVVVNAPASGRVRRAQKRSWEIEEG